MNNKSYYRDGDAITDIIPEGEYGTISIANLCERGDIVNGSKVKFTSLGMNFCYCVVLEKPAPVLGNKLLYNILYSWQIDTIETSTHKYIVDKTNEKEYIIKEVV